ncbi:GLPGLI family protein [Winogradskyella haliclonae]|uniref:GLPGLI family protein n=1 Tax=Winogradskyella haliclonae TaxID=2048558 RepID=A0ABQ2BVP1_9FLAO|nr:GLPGLI family protein [Winogradskyella haliclonae]GGI55798.1 GLPGLI family protein [Winogradskyella haliclonae]
MKLSVFKSLILVLAICLSSSTFGQDFQGKAYYQTKTTMDFSQFGRGGQQPSPEQMKRIQERMKSFLEKRYVLVFNREESIYKEEEKLEAQGGRGGFGAFASSLTSGPKYKNIKSKEILVDQEFFGKQFLIKDDLSPIQWTMGKESKQIGQYTVFKATATVPDTSFDMSSFRRPRGGEDKQEEEKTGRTVDVVAWYTPQVPVNQGPDNYWGLPGLILEVNAGNTTILCTKIVMNSKDKENIKKPEKGDVVTQEEYTKITTDKMEEFRNNRGRGRGRGRN